VNTLEVVLLSLMAGLLTSLLIAAAVYLAWMLHTTRKFLYTVQSASTQASTDISLLSIRIDGILNTHRQEMGSIISRINGDKLVEASHVILSAARRIETAAISFGQLAQSILGGEVEAEIRQTRSTGLGPESYAPNPTGERFIGQSRTAAQDGADLLAEFGADPEE